MRYTVLICWLVGFATVFSWRTVHAQQATPARPNVLLMMVDDMGWSDLGCYGGEIQTPNLDRLAAGGLRFTQFYNTAKCSETRATLLSGLYHPEVEIMKLDHCWTLADAMHVAGYATMMTGKWHLNGQPTERGFDKYFGHLSGATDFFVGDKSFRLNGQPFSVPEQGFYTTDANVEYALRFLTEAPQDQPFFCYIAFNAPHYPLQAPRQDVEKYLGKYALGWDALRQQRLARQKALGLLDEGFELTPRPADVPAWESLTAEQRRLEELRMATYAAMVDRVDQNVGRLIEYLQRAGKLDNTLIMFLSDNGACPFDRNHDLDKMPWEARSHWTYDKGWAHACNTPFREYKRNQHEGGIATPFIAHWPAGIQTPVGGLRGDVGHLVDVMPTLLELTGVIYPASYADRTLKPLRGRSLAPVFQGKALPKREALYFDWANQHHAVRQGDWKLVAKDRGPWELYNIADDRGEMEDLAAQQSDRRQAMQQQWEAWAKTVKLRGAQGAGKRKKTNAKKKSEQRDDQN